MTKRLAAEFIGTFALVLIGCGSAVLGGFGYVGQTGIAFAFGLAIVAMAYGIGPISGCHVNPAVSLGFWIVGRLKRDEFIGYVIAQVLGAIVGAGVLLIIASGAPDYTIAENGLGQNGWGLSENSQYSMISAFVFELIATFLFVVVILGATQKTAAAPLAGLAIGLTLTAIHIVGIQVTGVSVNPARSIGPAVWVMDKALIQLWLFIVAPLAGAALAGYAFRSKLLTAEET